MIIASLDLRFKHIPVIVLSWDVVIDVTSVAFLPSVEDWASAD
jgi:hypothetical protein